jgi:signal transduction histidine kinase
MKQTVIGLSRRYVAALQKHLRQGARASLRAARDLGCQAAASDLETLDMARMHDAALATLASCGSHGGARKRARIFFAAAITPIEETHRAALKSNALLSRLKQQLGRCTTDLAASCRTLKQGIIQRRTLKESGELSQELLKESRGLQKHLQRLTHQVLSAEEDHRKEISHELQDEIAQTLLGINVRLLALKQDAAANAHGFEAEIASTERLVDVSVKSIKKFAREIGSPHRAHLTRRQPHGENT